MSIDVCKKCSNYSGEFFDKWFCFERDQDYPGGNHLAIRKESRPPKHCDKKLEHGVWEALENKDVE